MNFTSDNTTGASPQILAALIAANLGLAASYGADPWSKRVEAQLATFFGREVEVFPVTTGTAANALSCAAICPPWGACLTHQESHVIDDECGAPEFFMGGAKLVGLPGMGGKLTPAAIDAHFAAEPGGTRRAPIKGLSIAQGTEFGLVYSVEELAALTAKAREHALYVHMDGARFWNALVSLGCDPAEMTWKSGIDILSLGGTKNGCLMAEAVVIFNLALAEDFRFKRKRSGQTLSKQRLISAQFEALLTDRHWEGLATHANGMAQMLAVGLQKAGLTLGWDRQINELFPIMPQALMDHLKAKGALFHEWSEISLPEGRQVGEGEVIVRLVTSFLTSQADVERFIALSRDFLAQK